jgi:hypothetical protein
MKIKTFALLLIFFNIQIYGQIQSVRVVPKKVTYRRTTDIDYKQKISVTYPKVFGLRNKKLARKIEASLSYEKLFDFDLKKDIAEDFLLDDAYYKVLYNKKGILNVLLSVDFSAAHESHYDKSVVINLNTGERVKPSDVFIKLKLEQLAAEVDKNLQAEITDTLKEIEKDYDAETLEYVKNQFGERTASIEDLEEFSVSDQGVTFIYHYYFSHISRNYEPSGEFFFSFQDLKPFIRRDGLLARFVR